MATKQWTVIKHHWPCPLTRNGQGMMPVNTCFHAEVYTPRGICAGTSFAWQWRRAKLHFAQNTVVCRPFLCLYVLIDLFCKAIRPWVHNDSNADVYNDRFLWFWGRTSMHKKPGKSKFCQKFLVTRFFVRSGRAGTAVDLYLSNAAA